MGQDLHRCFERHFHPEVALSHSQFDDAFRLRYQVYCLEKGSRTRALSGRLRARPLRRTLRADARPAPGHRPRGRCSPTDPARPVGAFVVVPFRGPLRLHGAWAPPGRSRRPAARRWGSVAVRRVAEPAGVGLGAGDGSLDGAPRGRPEERCSSQLVALGLIALLFGVSAEYGVHTWYAMMEAALARHLARLGIEFRQIGPAVEHRGRRQPMAARVDDLFGPHRGYEPGVSSPHHRGPKCHEGARMVWQRLEAWAR